MPPALRWGCPSVARGEAIPAKTAPVLSRCRHLDASQHSLDVKMLSTGRWPRWGPGAGSCLLQFRLAHGEELLPATERGEKVGNSRALRGLLWPAPRQP